MDRKEGCDLRVPNRQLRGQVARDHRLPHQLTRDGQVETQRLTNSHWPMLCAATIKRVFVVVVVVDVVVVPFVE